jgi:hypothetical protein
MNNATKRKTKKESNMISRSTKRIKLYELNLFYYTTFTKLGEKYVIT